MARLSRFYALVCFVALSSAASADVEEARRHYERGTALYDLRRFAEAAREYEKAFEEKPDPALLFNIGQAYRFAHDYPNAIGAYRMYLRRLPETSNRAEVEGRIAELQRALDEQHKAQPAHEQPPSPPMQNASPVVQASPAAPEGSQAPDRARIRTLKIAGVACFAVGLATIGVGGAMTALASNAANDLNHPRSGMFDPSAEDRRNTYQSIEVAAFAVGGAAAVAGVVLYGVGVKKSGSYKLAASTGGWSAFSLGASF